MLEIVFCCGSLCQAVLREVERDTKLRKFGGTHVGYLNMSSLCRLPEKQVFWSRWDKYELCETLWYASRMDVARWQ